MHPIQIQFPFRFDTLLLLRFSHCLSLSLTSTVPLFHNFPLPQVSTIIRFPFPFTQVSVNSPTLLPFPNPTPSRNHIPIPIPIPTHPPTTASSTPIKSPHNTTTIYSQMAKMMLRVRSRDGLERVTVENPQGTTVSELKSLIQTQLRIPFQNQTISTNQNLLLAKTQEEIARFTDMANPNTPLTALNLAHGSIVYLAYDGERTVAGPAFHPAGSFGRKMTMDDLIAKQMKVTRQENPHCELVSFDRDCANAFQHYVSETLAFAVKRGGFMYGTVSEEGKVEVDFIYEPPQQGTEENLVFYRDPEEEKAVEAIAMGLGMRRVGFIFTQSVSQDTKDYTLSNREVLQAAEFHSKGGLKEWVTAMVKLEVNEDGGADVHFEAFQMSDICIRLFKEGWFETEIGEGDDPKLSKMKKDVVLGVKDTKEVDNDFFLVVVKIFDHQGPLSSSFPIENRNTLVTLKALKTHLDRAKNLPLVKRISDFHLLLLLARFLDVANDVPALAVCVHTQSPIPEGYQLLIETMANTS